VATSLPLVVDAGFKPARVVLDAKPPNGISQADFRFAINHGDDVVAQGMLNSSTTPLALEPGDYNVHAWLVSGAITVGHSLCDLQLSVDAEADIAYYAQFSIRHGCTWKEGTWPFG
jgi:hypothetical protein